MSRWLEFIIAFASIVLLLPISLVIGIMIKLTSLGPVLFKQKRVGKNFREFNIFKFRTMINGAHEKGPLITTGNDSRITPVGKVLRKYKIDELPQLINILKGEMSFVGPRPEVPEYVEKFKEQYSIILKARPGITDPASLEYRHEEIVLENHSDDPCYYENILLPAKLKLSRSYMEHKSFLTDIEFIIKTIVTTISPLKKHIKP